MIGCLTRGRNRIRTVRRDKMPKLVYSAPPETAALDVYLQAAARIVETVAFEMAPQTSSAAVEELLKLACGIERAADNLRHDA